MTFSPIRSKSRRFFFFPLFIVGLAYYNSTENFAIGSTTKLAIVRGPCAHVNERVVRARMKILLATRATEVVRFDSLPSVFYLLPSFLLFRFLSRSQL